MTQVMVVPPLIEAVEALAPLIRKHADEAEEARSLSRPVFEAMVDAGRFRMLVPRAYGGLEMPIVDAFKVVERVSAIDSAAGWCLQITGIDSPTVGALFPDATAREVFGNPRAVAAGGFNPPGMASRVDGGYRLTGR